MTNRSFAQFENVQLNQLHENIVEQFSLDELRTLCFNLGIEYENLGGGNTRNDKARELINHMQRLGRLQELRLALQKERPNHNWIGQPPDDIPCPYRGLSHFREEDAANFFGRETYTEKLVKAVENQTFIALVGPSGSGKSSVVFAGLVPRLRAERKWLIVSFRPGNRPFYNLAYTLVTLDKTIASQTDRLDETRRLEQALSRDESPLPLNDVFQDILINYERKTKLLLIVNQFEELFTLYSDPKLQQHFLDALLSVNNNEIPIKLLVTIRADFIGQALSNRNFADTLQNNDIKLGPMTNDELRRAILYPAKNVGVNFEPGLVNVILKEIGYESGNLPLLQFALKQLWDRQNQRVLTHDAYESIGRIEGALSNYADEEYNKLDNEQKVKARNIFTRLVQLGGYTEPARKIVLKDELVSEWSLVQKLASLRLVVTNQFSDEYETVEVAHEALIRHWERLRNWVFEDFDFLIRLEQLRNAQYLWDINKHREDALAQGIQLLFARDLLDKIPERLSQTEIEFIQTSINLENRKSRWDKIWKAVIFGISLTLIILSMMGVWIQRHELLKQCLPDCSNWGLFLSGVDWRDEDLHNANLQSANLHAADLRETNMYGANLNKANLDGSNLRNANLSLANLQEAYLVFADLSEANLTFSYLNNADLRFANLSGSDLRGAHLNGSNLDHTNLKGALIDDATQIDDKWLLVWEIVNQEPIEQDLSGTDLSNAKLQDTDLSFFDLSDTNFVNANLSGSDLRGVDLSNANLSNANLILANLEGANLQATNLSETNLQWANLIDAKINDATHINEKWYLVWQIVNQNLGNQQLKGADLSKVNFHGADLQYLDLSNVDLRYSDLSNANLGGTNLQGANLIDADLRGTNLFNTNFDENTQIDDKWYLVWQIVNQNEIGRDLSSIDLSDANLSGANFINANFQGTNLRAANLNNTNLSGANLKDAFLAKASLLNAIINDETQMDEQSFRVWQIVNNGAENENLSGIHLPSVNLNDASLRGANLSNAYLRDTDLNNTDLRDTNLRNANLGDTDLQNTLLQGAQYNNDTIWPTGFDPESAGAILVEEIDE